MLCVELQCNVLVNSLCICFLLPDNLVCYDLQRCIFHIPIHHLTILLTVIASFYVVTIVDFACKKAESYFVVVVMKSVA